MAAKEATATLNKSDVVREYLSAHAAAPVKEVAAALSQQGVEVSLALINKIKYNDHKSSAGQGKKMGRGRRRGAGGSSKAQSIRDALGHLGRAARPRDVIAHLKAAGIEVSPAQVSAVRKSFRKRGRLAHGGSAASRVAHNGNAVSVEHLFAAKRLADQVGLEEAKRALEFLAKLSP